ncbi:hypothetical protein ACJRO7_031434 [Eucalyptus globulus]|uniref:Transmembrane protein n=1 Tax=Eucalyptus globulus TaxID=34317 RepID=A0ABD3JK68_EUCGL
MSLQLLQPAPPPPPQTVTVFPDTFTRPQPSSSSQQHSHSSGSFGTVFMVLAIVLAVSAIACCFGRFCNRRSRTDDPSAKQTRRPHPRENDIEFGFDGRTRTGANPTVGNNGGIDGRTRTVANPTAGNNKGGSQAIHDNDKGGLGGGFHFQQRAVIDEPKPGA